MDIEDIRAVCAAWTYGSYFEAAYQLSLEYSVISKKILRVEKKLGIRIFRRAVKGTPLALTEEGSAIIHRLQQLVANYDGILQSVSKFSAGNTAALRIGYWRTIGTFGETQLIRSFALENPQCQISRSVRPSTELLPMLLAGKLDCCFLGIFRKEYLDILPPDQFETRSLARVNRLNLAISTAHPASLCPVLNRENFHILEGSTILFDSRQPAGKSDDLLNFLGLSGKCKVQYVDLTDPELAIYFVKENKGILPQACLLPGGLEDIRFVPVEGWPDNIFFYMAYSKHNISPMLRKFIDFSTKFFNERTDADRYLL